MSRFLVGLLLTLTATASAQETTYWQDVRPALRKYCIACHNTRNLKEVDVSGGLALDSFDVFMKSPKKPVVLPGKSGASELLKRVVTKDENLRMPPTDTVVPMETVALLKRWIDTGAREGKKPDDVAPTVTTAPPKRRKLPVSLMTAAVPPPGILDTGKPDRLQLSLRIGPLSPVTAVTFSPDGTLLAVGSYGRVTVWNLSDVKPVKVLTSVLGAVHDLRFSPDGALLAVGGGQPSAQGDLRLFQVADWKLKGVLRGHDDVIASMAFRPDGKKLVSASFDKTLRIWDLSTLKSEATLEPHSDFVYAVAYSPDGKTLASASKDRTVKLLDAEQLKSKLTFSGMTQDVLAVAFIGDGQKVLSSGYEPGIYWWNAKTAERERLQGGHRVAVHEISTSKDGKVFATAGGDGNVLIWDGVSGVSQRTLSAGSLVYAVGLSGDARLVAAGSFDGLVRLFEVKTGRQLLTLLNAAGTGEEGDWVALTPEGYATSSKSAVESGEWQMANRRLASGSVWKSLGQGELVRKAVRGDTLPPPVFQK